MWFKENKVYHTIHPDNAAKGGSVVIKESIIYEKEKSYKYRTAIYCPLRQVLKRIARVKVF